MNLLFVSIAFPPKKDPECVQTARYFKYLSRSDLSIEVLTSSDPTLFMPVDEALNVFDTGYLHKVELPIRENKYVNYIKRKLGLSTGLPDTKHSFHTQLKEAVQEIKKLPDVIYSRSYPLSSAIMAYKLADYYGVPWVMHLSDPWVDSPLHHYSTIELDYHREWEEKSFNKASAICLTSEKTIDWYTRKYPDMKDKLFLFPNVYDRDDIESEQISFDKKCRIVYTGGFAGTRSPEVFFQALELFNKRDENHSKLEVVFAGPLDHKMNRLIEDFRGDNFKHVGYLSLNESIQLQRSAHALLIIDTDVNNPELAMFFPSKILEYLVARRRVIAITSHESATEHMMNSLDLDSFNFNEADQLANYFSKLLVEFENRNEAFFVLEDVPVEYDAEVNAIRLVDLIKKV